MTARLREHATYADVIAAPDNLIAELTDGELHLSPRPAARHASFASVLGMLLGPPYHLGTGGPGGWWILYEPEIHFEPRTVVFVPDLAGWRRERMPEIPDEAFFEIVPDWVCEVLSTSTARYDRTVKLPAYARYGVKHAWIADPLARTVEVMRLYEEKWLTIATYSGEDRFRAEPFDAVEIDLKLIWGPDPEEPSPPAP